MPVEGPPYGLGRGLRIWWGFLCGFFRLVRYPPSLASSSCTSTFVQFLLRDDLLIPHPYHPIFFFARTVFAFPSFFLSSYLIVGDLTSPFKSWMFEVMIVSVYLLNEFPFLSLPYPKGDTLRCRTRLLFFFPLNGPFQSFDAVNP